MVTQLTTVYTQAHQLAFSLALQAQNAYQYELGSSDTFYLETMIGKYADNLKSLRGFKFDWSRNDANFDHVYANQAFTHKLNEFGIVHQAEEFNDTSGEPDWGTDGRFMTEVLPFFARYLVFDIDPQIHHQ